MNLSNLVRAAEKLKNKVLKTPMEQLLEEATSDENWNTSNKLLNEVADSSFSFQDQAVIMKHIETRLDTNKTKKWRKIEKTLGLMDHLIKFGSPRCTSEFRDILYLINKLKHYEVHEQGQDKGAAIREKATNLSDLLDDEQRIIQVRKDAQELKEKLSSIGGISANSNKYSGMGSGSYGGQGGSQANAREYGSGVTSRKDDVHSQYGGKQELGTYDDYDWEKKIQQKLKTTNQQEVKIQVQEDIQDQIKNLKEQQAPPKKLIKITPPSQNQNVHVQPPKQQQQPAKSNVNLIDNLFDFDEPQQSTNNNTKQNQQEDFSQFQQFQQQPNQQQKQQQQQQQQTEFGGFQNFQQAQPQQIQNNQSNIQQNNNQSQQQIPQQQQNQQVKIVYNNKPQDNQIQTTQQVKKIDDLVDLTGGLDIKEITKQQTNNNNNMMNHNMMNNNMQQNNMMNNTMQQNNMMNNNMQQNNMMNNNMMQNNMMQNNNNMMQNNNNMGGFNNMNYNNIQQQMNMMNQQQNQLQNNNNMMNF